MKREGISSSPEPLGFSTMSSTAAPPSQDRRFQAASKGR